MFPRSVTGNIGLNGENRKMEEGLLLLVTVID